MEIRTLQDRIDRGRGIAARHIGSAYDAYRTTAAANPMNSVNRYLRLLAAFVPENGSFQKPSGYGRATWLGLFDSAYTRPGDYLLGPGGTFFIAAQQSLLPVLCVLANRTLTLSRPAAPTLPGMNGYGGTVLATTTPLLTAWPGSVLTAGTGSPGTLPGDGNLPSWTILLPVTPAMLRPADLVQDDLGRTYVIGTAELTALGWRILAKQAAT